jgi:hypothetical protein
MRIVAAEAADRNRPPLLVEQREIRRVLTHFAVNAASARGGVLRERLRRGIDATVGLRIVGPDFLEMNIAILHEHLAPDALANLGVLDVTLADKELHRHGRHVVGDGLVVDDENLLGGLDFENFALDRVALLRVGRRRRARRLLRHRLFLFSATGRDTTGH